MRCRALFNNSGSNMYGRVPERGKAIRLISGANRKALDFIGGFYSFMDSTAILPLKLWISPAVRLLFRGYGVKI